MPYKDPDKQRAFQRQSVARRRLAWINANGPCAQCGSADRLEVDHIDPALKEMQPRNIWSRRKEVQERELAKCQVLCKRCHFAKTFEGLGGHGTASRYEKGCRCSSCRAAHAAKNKAWRARRKARPTH